MSATSLVTDGFICYRGQPIPVPQPASLDTPDVTGVVEVRPKIRRVTPPSDAQPVPMVTSVQELKPQVSGKAEPEPTSPVDPPTTKTAQELKPKITEAKEED